MDRWMDGYNGGFHPFTPKSDQFQISPAALPEILHHTVWRTWLFITYSDGRWLYYQFSLLHLYIISLSKVGRMYFLNLWGWQTWLTVAFVEFRRGCMNSQITSKLCLMFTCFIIWSSSSIPLGADTYMIILFSTKGSCKFVDTNCLTDGTTAFQSSTKEKSCVHQR